MDLPNVARVAREYAHPEVRDAAVEVRRALESLRLGDAVRPGQRVAVACSSRGITGYASIVAATVAVLREAGLEPFLVPAMGSHGSGTAEGQARVLAHQGITGETVGAPVRSSLETVVVGATSDGVPVYIDRLASEADHIILINRVKEHTEFESDAFQSGIQKMLAIGLGKQRGASVCHDAMFAFGYERVLASVARVVLERAPVLAAVAVVENGSGRTARVEAARAGDIAAMETRLLALARELAAGLPFPDADVVVLDEIGKDVSGTGFDTKVLGRIGLPLLSPEPASPRVKRIVACDLTVASEGNAIGVGLADFVTRRLVEKIDLEALATNALTGGTPEMARIPMVLPCDREAIAAAVKCLGSPAPGRLKLVRVRNTSLLTQLELSQAYLDEGPLPAGLEVLETPRPLAFDARGDLLPLGSLPGVSPRSPGMWRA